MSKYNILMKVLIIFLSFLIASVNVYALIVGMNSFSAYMAIIDSSLFIVIFLLLGIKEVKENSKICYLYFIFVLAMLIIIGLKTCFPR
jgi:hypothetical protein